FEEAAAAIAESGAMSAEQLAAEDAQFRQAAAVGVDSTAALFLSPVDEAEAEAVREAGAGKAEQEGTGQGTAGAAAEIGGEKEKLSDLSPAGKIRMATLGNAFARAVLIRDKNKQVSMACIRSPAVSESEVLRYAANRSLDDEIIGYIARQRQWVRLYGVKVAL